MEFVPVNAAPLDNIDCVHYGSYDENHTTWNNSNFEFRSAKPAHDDGKQYIPQ